MEKYENISIPPKLEDDGQIIIPFGEKELKKEIHEQEVKRIFDIVQGLNEKYPKAKLNSAIVEAKGDEGFTVGSFSFKNFEELENHVKEMNEEWDRSTDSQKDW